MKVSAPRIAADARQTCLSGTFGLSLRVPPQLWLEPATAMHVLRTITAYPREAIGVGVITAAAFFAVLGLTLDPAASLSGPAEASVPVRPVVSLGKPPEPEPLRFKDVAPEDARTINAVLPFSDAPNPAARPFAAKFADTRNEARALDCLTAAVYYEAAIESADGQRAVAQVVLNRLRHPAYPSTVCGVVFQGSERSTGCQFTFTCDGALARRPNPALWDRARAVAWAALSGRVFAPVGWATHYHTDWVVPYWASSLSKTVKVGTHIFYRWTGGWGRPPAFRGRYAGIEGSFGKMAALSGAHADAIDDVAVAANGALDGLSASDEIVIGSAGPGRVTMQLNPAAATGGQVAMAANTEAKIPWELRWALTGAGANAPEAALGPAATKPAVSKTPAAQPAATKPAAAKPLVAKNADTSATCAKDVMLFVPSGKSDSTFTVRERCGT